MEKADHRLRWLLRVRFPRPHHRRAAETGYELPPSLMSRLVWLAKFFAISPAKGAETIVYLASSPDVAETTGQYFYKSVPTAPSSWAQDSRSALLLWQRRAALVGIME